MAAGVRSTVPNRPWKASLWSSCSRKWLRIQVNALGLSVKAASIELQWNKGIVGNVATSQESYFNCGSTMSYSQTITPLLSISTQVTKILNSQSGTATHHKPTVQTDRHFHTRSPQHDGLRPFQTLQRRRTMERPTTPSQRIRSTPPRPPRQKSQARCFRPATSRTQACTSRRRQCQDA